MCASPVLSFPDVKSLPMTDADAISNTMIALYASIFTVGHDNIPSSYLSFLSGPRIKNTLTYALNFLKKSTRPNVSVSASIILENLNRGVFPLRAITTLIVNSDLSCPVTKAIGTWLLVAYSDTPVSGGSTTCPVVLINADLSCTINPYLPEVDLHLLDDPGIMKLPAFWRWLIAVTVGYEDVTNPTDLIVSEILPYVAIALTPSTAMSVYAKGDWTAPLPNLINTLYSLDVLYPSTDTVLPQKRDFRRIMWQYWMTLGNPTLSVRGPMGFVVWNGIAREMGAGSQYQRIVSVLTGLGTPTQMSDVLQNDAGFVSAVESFAVEAATTDSDPSEEPDAYVADDDTSSTTGDDISSSDAAGNATSSLGATPPVRKDKNSNAIGETGTSGGNTSLIQLETGTASDPLNAYVYRRAVLAVNRLLEETDDLTVSHDAREALGDWCREWLWVADVSQTQKLIRELGLQKFVATVKS